MKPSLGWHRAAPTDAYTDESYGSVFHACILRVFHPWVSVPSGCPDCNIPTHSGWLAMKFVKIHAHSTFRTLECTILFPTRKYKSKTSSKGGSRVHHLHDHGGERSGSIVDLFVFSKVWEIRELLVVLKLMSFKVMSLSVVCWIDSISFATLSSDSQRNTGCLCCFCFLDYMRQ